MKATFAARRRGLRRFLCPFAVAFVLCVGCVGNEQDGNASSPGDAGGAGPGISVAEVLRSHADPPYLVRGYFVRQGDSVQLCGALSESFPPHCGGPSLYLRGDVDLGRLGPLRTEGLTPWSERPVLLLGEVRDGEMLITSRARTARPTLGASLTGS